MRTFPSYRLLNSTKSIGQKNLNNLKFLLFHIYKPLKAEGFFVQALLFLFPFRTLIFILYPTLLVLLHGVRRAAYNTCGRRDTMRTTAVTQHVPQPPHTAFSKSRVKEIEDFDYIFRNKGWRLKEKNPRKIGDARA